MILSISPFRKYLGSSVEPMKNPPNAIISVAIKLSEGRFIERSRNSANRKSTISGWKI